MTPPLARFVPTITRGALSSHLTGLLAPLHIGQALTSHWPARSSWRISDGFATIRAVGEHKEVEVEVGKRGRGYLDPDFQRMNMGLGELPDHRRCQQLTRRPVPRRVHLGQDPFR